MGKAAIAFTDSMGDGDGRGVALGLVDPMTGAEGGLVHANTTTSYDQSDPDALWIGGTLVVAWVDDSDPDTGPDVRLRTFDASLSPTSDEETLAASADVESDVALASFGGTWAAAWRDSKEGMESTLVRAGSSLWSVGPYVPADADDRPALLALDDTHLLLAFTVGVDLDDAGITDGDQLHLAILSTDAAGPANDVVLTTGEPALDAGSVSQPSLARVGDSIYLAYKTAAVPGSMLGEELFTRALSWDGSAKSLDTSQIPQRPLTDRFTGGDQRRPSLATGALCPDGALGLVWEDWGQELSQTSPTEVGFAFVPTPIVLIAQGG
jgi:hypothetical protein